MFKPKLIPPINQKKRPDDEKKEGDENEEDNVDDNPAKRAFLKQIAHITELHEHAGKPGECANRDCLCVHGPVKHNHEAREHRPRSAYVTKSMASVMERLARPQSGFKRH